MRVIHVTRRRMALMSLALCLVIGAALMLAGCFGGDKEVEVITAAANEDRRVSGALTPSCRRDRTCPLPTSAARL